MHGAAHGLASDGTAPRTHAAPPTSEVAAGITKRERLERVQLERSDSNSEQGGEARVAGRGSVAGAVILASIPRSRAARAEFVSWSAS